eukprot:TRINITY_DN2055_c0_g1_i3.p1 TRINITY_DN2055_c0_g1~~TRINITY_DN2055_c0_g1_i3.p1  ORF type:complete len:287 (-),score=76.27 TRINITY_DN2055_c0_g1_i3:244-1104(-)
MKGEVREDEEMQDEMGEAVFHAVKHLGEEALNWGDAEDDAIISGDDTTTNNNNDDPNVHSLISMPFSPHMDGGGGGVVIGGRDRSGSQNGFARRNQQQQQHLLRGSTTSSHHPNSNVRRYSADHTDPDGSLERIDANNNNSFNNRPPYFPPATRQGRGSIEEPYGPPPTPPLVSPLNKYLPAGGHSSSMDGSTRKDSSSVDLATQLVVGANQKGPSAARLKRVVAYIEHVRQRDKKKKRRSTAGGGGASGDIDTSGPSEVGNPFYDVVMQAIQAAKLQQQQQQPKS